MRCDIFDHGGKKIYANSIKNSWSQSENIVKEMGNNILSTLGQDTIDKLDKLGIDIEINYCRHHPKSNCKCRKPSPSMILRYEISPKDIFLGDKDTDMIAAKAAGIKNRWIISDLPKGPFTNAFINSSKLL